MPSVNLSRLRLQAFELAGLLDDPAAFRSSLRSLLNEHSHRLLRRGQSMAKRGALPAWDVSGLLIRELEATLLAAAQKKKEAVLGAAVAIWPDGKLEEKKLAAFLVGLSDAPGEIRTLLLQWLKETEDPGVLQDLAAHACPPLWNSDRILFRSDARGWIEDPVPSRRRFGWMALQAWAEAKTSESVFAAFDLLPLVFSETDPEAKQLASDLLAKVAESSPREAQGWLAEQTPKSRQKGRRFLRMALPRLSGETAAFLHSLLQEK